MGRVSTLEELPRDPYDALRALAAALDGSGPALLPLPPERAAAARLIEAVRPAEPLEHRGAALVVGTSGSTGEPKGVVLSAAALRASAAATAARVGTGRWMLALPLHHVAGLQVLLRSLLAGTTPVVQDLADGFTAEAFAAATERLGPGPRLTSLVPTQLLRLLAAGGAAVDALRSYDAVLVGGAATAPDLLERAREAGARVVTTYGMTETCGGCVYDGRALDGVDVTVGGDGRVRIGGAVLFSGYRLRPDLTAAALEDGALVTGDLGRLSPDGQLEILGRADDVLVSGGEKVALAAVEAAAATLPNVREAAAVALPDPEWGQRVGLLVVADGRAPDLAELRRHLVRLLGRAAAPAALAVVPALPLLGVGKPDRRAAAALLGRAAPLE